MQNAWVSDITLSGARPGARSIINGPGMFIYFWDTRRKVLQAHLLNKLHHTHPGMTCRMLDQQNRLQVETGCLFRVTSVRTRPRMIFLYNARKNDAVQSGLGPKYTFNSAGSSFFNVHVSKCTQNIHVARYFILNIYDT